MSDILSETVTHSVNSLVPSSMAVDKFGGVNFLSKTLNDYIVSLSYTVHTEIPKIWGGCSTPKHRLGCGLE